MSTKKTSVVRKTKHLKKTTASQSFSRNELNNECETSENADAVFVPANENLTLPLDRSKSKQLTNRGTLDARRRGLNDSSSSDASYASLVEAVHRIIKRLNFTEERMKRKEEFYKRQAQIERSSKKKQGGKRKEQKKQKGAKKAKKDDLRIEPVSYYAEPTQSGCVLSGEVGDERPVECPDLAKTSNHDKLSPTRAIVFSSDDQLVPSTYPYLPSINKSLASCHPSKRKPLNSNKNPPTPFIEGPTKNNTKLNNRLLMRFKTQAQSPRVPPLIDLNKKKYPNIQPKVDCHNAEYKRNRNKVFHPDEIIDLRITKNERFTMDLDKASKLTPKRNFFK